MFENDSIHKTYQKRSKKRIPTKTRTHVIVHFRQGCNSVTRHVANPVSPNGNFMRILLSGEEEDVACGRRVAQARRKKKHRKTDGKNPRNDGLTKWVSLKIVYP